MFSVIDLIIIILNILIILIVAILFSYFRLFLYGAPYVPSDITKVKKMIELAELNPTDTTVDLGSGDGRIVIESAGTAGKSLGYEISQTLVIYANHKIKKAGLGHKASTHRKNFLKEDLSIFDVIFIYQLPMVMKILSRKLEKELKPGARIVCNGFTMPGWNLVKSEDNVHLYVK